MDETATARNMRAALVGRDEVQKVGGAVAPHVRDQAYLRRIVADSASIAERLHGAFEPIENDASTTLGRERLRRWRDKLAGSGPVAFERRLQWLTTSPDRAAPRLGEVRFTGSLPGWADWLARWTRCRTRPAAMTARARSPH